MNPKLFLPRIFSPLIAAVIVLLAILACNQSSNAPSEPSATEVLPLEPVPTQASPYEPITPIPTSQPAIPERRFLIVEFPPQIRAGDSDRVRLTLEVDEQGNITPTAIVDGNVVTGEVIEIPNLYETHHVVAEAKFDIAGLEVSPPDLSSQTLEQGQSVTFFWSIRPTEVGVYRGTIWLYLRFVDKVSEEESRKTVSAQSVDIEAVNLFGLSANLARSLGAVGSVIGAIVGFPFFEEIVKFIFSRRKRRSR